MNAAQRIYRLALRAYPAPFREEYEREMVLLFNNRWRREPAWIERTLLSMQSLADIAMGAPREHYDMWTQDLQYTFRTLRKAPAFALAAIATIALAIAAATTMFSVVHAVMLRPLPFPQPDKLVRVWETSSRRNIPFFAASILNFLDWRQRATTIELAAFGASTFNLSHAGEPQRVAAATVSPSFFSVLAVSPLYGRAFHPDEEQPGKHRVAILSENYWRNRFGADPNLIGRGISLSGVEHTVVGIMPAALQMPAGTNIWVPRAIVPKQESRGNHVITVIGRLRPGFTLQQADAELTSIARQLEKEFPESNRDWGIRTASFYDWVIPEQLRQSLTLLLGAVGMLLLIACANVANLLLSRSSVRQREIAIRLAIGASRRRVIRQLMTESTVLAFAGGALGVLLAYWSIAVVRTNLPPGIPRADQIALDSYVLAFAVCALTACVFLFGLGPALQLSRNSTNSTLQQGGRSSAGRSSLLLRNALVSTQLAMATLLVIGAALLAQSFIRLQNVTLGFDASNLLTAGVSLPDAKYPTSEAQNNVYRQLQQSLAATPGISSAAISSGIPFAPGAYTQMQVVRATNSTLAAGETVTADWRIASPEYFHTMRIPLRRGREFNYRDAEDAAPVMIISNQLAHRLWPASDAVGQQLQLENRVTFQIIGVVGDALMGNLAQPARPAVYFSLTQMIWPGMSIAIRTTGDPMAAQGILRAKLREIDPTLPLANVRPLEHWVENSTARPRFQSTLLAVFSGLALLLAGVGIYGVMSYSVAQRTSEIGIRVALGALHTDVLRLILKQGLKLIAAGVAAGIAASLLLGSAISSMLFGIQPRDAMTLVLVPAVLTLCALIACLVPALHATRVNPVLALRGE